MASSRTSSTCRIEWRPSRLRGACLVGIGVLAGASVLLSDAPPFAAGALAFALPAYSSWLAWREGRRPHATLVWRPGEAQALLLEAGAMRRLDTLNVRWRGPLATLGARDEAGKLRRLSWWPDTLPPPARRALRLAADGSSPRAGAAGAPRAAARASTTMGT